MNWKNHGCEYEMIKTSTASILKGWGWVKYRAVDGAIEYQMVLWVCSFYISLGQWPSPHSRHHCTLMAETLVIIPVVTAMDDANNGLER